MKGRDSIHPELVALQPVSADVLQKRAASRTRPFCCAAIRAAARKAMLRLCFNSKRADFTIGDERGILR
jgi:hypothetical protein